MAVIEQTDWATECGWAIEVDDLEVEPTPEFKSPPNPYLVTPIAFVRNIAVIEVDAIGPFTHEQMKAIHEAAVLHREIAGWHVHRATLNPVAPAPEEFSMSVYQVKLGPTQELTLELSKGRERLSDMNVELADLGKAVPGITNWRRLA